LHDLIDPQWLAHDVYGEDTIGGDLSDYLGGGRVKESFNRWYVDRIPVYLELNPESWIDWAAARHRRFLLVRDGRRERRLEEKDGLRDPLQILSTPPIVESGDRQNRAVSSRFGWLVTPPVWYVTKVEARLVVIVPIEIDDQLPILPGRGGSKFEVLTEGLGRESTDSFASSPRAVEPDGAGVALLFVGRDAHPPTLHLCEGHACAVVFDAQLKLECVFRLTRVLRVLSSGEVELDTRGVGVVGVLDQLAHSRYTIAYQLLAELPNVAGVDLKVESSGVGYLVGNLPGHRASA
jgi:hypothetical protein